MWHVECNKIKTTEIAHSLVDQEKHADEKDYPTHSNDGQRDAVRCTANGLGVAVVAQEQDRLVEDSLASEEINEVLVPHDVWRYPCCTEGKVWGSEVAPHLCRPTAR